VTDETPENRTRRPRPVPPGDAPPSSAPGVAPDDPDAALRRLESMGAPRQASPSPPPSSFPPDPLPPQPAVDSFGAPPPPRSQRPMGSSKRTAKVRPKPAGSRSSRMVARIVAPVVFLVAVIALLGIVVNSGVMGGSDEPVTTPTVKATKTTNSGAKTTKKYVVKSGDSLSSIAVRFNTSTTELQDMNPDLSGSTLVVGQRIVVPAQ
jgi:LysM repeat protein